MCYGDNKRVASRKSKDNVRECTKSSEKQVINHTNPTRNTSLVSSDVVDLPFSNYKIFLVIEP